VHETANVNELLRIDESCTKESELVFGALGESATKCADAALRMFAAAAQYANAVKDRRAASDEFNALAKDLDVDGPKLLVMLKAARSAVEDPRITKARGLDKEVQHALAGRTLLQLCWRSYRWAITDLRRLKLTSASGWVRVELESVALMLLFRKDPSLAERWINPKENMITFFRETQPSVKEILKSRNLMQAYEHGSAVAQHARFASAARGLRLPDGDVLDQEFDPKEPVSFHLGLAYFYRVQTRIFSAFPDVFEGLGDDGIYQDEFKVYQELEEKTWWVMERKYAEEIRDFYVE
jgi:hypothetical protein